MEERLLTDINSVPDDCVCEIISRTSPRDACNFSLTSASFRWVLDSDFVWQSFLPSDCATILSRAVEPVVYASKKDLFFRLAERHMLIDGGTMSFGLDKSSGAKCYMLSTSLLEIGSADEPHLYWRQFSLPDSRFAQVVQPKFQCWLSIAGRMDANMLSKNTRYGAYLVYKLTKASDDDFLHKIGQSRQHASVYAGKHRSTNSTVYLEPFYDRLVRKSLGEWKISCDELGETAKSRDDGWMEVEIGEFYNDDGVDGDVYMKLEEVDGHSWQGGIILQGIEIKPKH